jgi:glycosyltransferase involved in cell wall biosynthesis
MKAARLASIIINNYNYARFLPQAIDSALGQTYGNVEVIVVDDGSTDDSRDVIAQYVGRVVPVLKENGGQTSTFNQGFRASHGEVVCFLDADDVLQSTAIERAMQRFVAPDLSKVHWPLWIIDGDGRRTRRVKPAAPLREGDLRDIVIHDGPDSSTWPPTSGNAWARSFLERVLPIPETERECGVGSASADAYLSMLAPLFGLVGSIPEPQAYYRVHGQNDHSAMNFERRLARDLLLFRHRAEVLTRYCREAGLEVDPGVWERNSWFHRLRQALDDIDSVIPAGASFVLVDNNHWMTGDTVAGRRRIPFLERNGEYWGPPANDEEAIQELERLRSAGFGFFVLAWPAFWWLDHYVGFAHHLGSRLRCALRNERVIVFDASG